MAGGENWRLARRHRGKRQAGRESGTGIADAGPHRLAYAMPRMVHSPQKTAIQRTVDHYRSWRPGQRKLEELIDLGTLTCFSADDVSIVKQTSSVCLGEHANS